MLSFDFLPPEASLVARAALNMALGGVLAMYVRALYRRFSSSIGGRDSFSAVFPMLTAVTVLIIFVVKSSLALSLGPADLVPAPGAGVTSFEDAVAALVSGNAYFNVHTMANPDGEIRGQILAPGP